MIPLFVISMYIGFVSEEHYRELVTELFQLISKTDLSFHYHKFRFPNKEYVYGFSYFVCLSYLTLFYIGKHRIINFSLKIVLSSLCLFMISAVTTFLYLSTITKNFTTEESYFIDLIPFDFIFLFSIYTSILWGIIPIIKRARKHLFSQP